MAVGLALLRRSSVVVLVASCGLLPGGISRDRAVEIASQHTGMSNAVLVDAVVSEASAIEWLGPPPEGRLWIVRFRGIATICPPGQNPCLDQVAETLVYLEYETGEFITAGTGPIP